MKYTSTFIFMVIFFVGGANASPTKINDRAEYSASLNSIASVVMTWYGSLINTNATENTIKLTDQRVNFNTNNIADHWDEYRSQYPKNINQLVITNTQLLKQGSDYYFTVNSNISFMLKNKAHTDSFKELFIFSNSILKQAINLSYPLKNVQLEERQEKPISNRTAYNRKHYKMREFTYAWLSHLEGLTTLDYVMNAGAWIDKATYSLEIGADKFKGSISSILKKRKTLLAKGGHLLRSLDIRKTDSNNTFILELIFEWKGKNDEGMPVIAKIKQELKIHIKADKSWEVIRIKEKHLLPIVAPWMGLLC
jgi:hypothetical protein